MDTATSLAEAELRERKLVRLLGHSYILQLFGKRTAAAKKAPRRKAWSRECRGLSKNRIISVFGDNFLYTSFGMY